MTEQMKGGGVAVVDRELPQMEQFAGTEITTPAAYAARIREMQGRAHILSPMAAVARIAPSHVIIRWSS